MGDVLVMQGGGGGVDCDNATAKAGDILAGKTAGIAGADEPVPGTMPNRGAWTGRIGVNGRVAIPAGCHNGGGYVDQSITDRGAWTGSVGMNGRVAVPGGHHNGAGYVDGPMVTQRGAPTYNLPINGTQNLPEGYYSGGRVTQSIPTFGGQTITPSTSQQTVSCNGKYMTGNVVVKGVSNLSAGNIKKGVAVGGVNGSCEWAVSHGANTMKGELVYECNANLSSSSYRIVAEAIGNGTKVFQSGPVYPSYPYIIFNVSVSVNNGEYIFDFWNRPLGKGGAGQSFKSCTYNRNNSTGYALLSGVIYREEDGSMEGYFFSTCNGVCNIRIYITGGTSADING